MVEHVFETGQPSRQHFLHAVAARADDTRPPVISEVKTTQRGGQVVIEARITDETGVLSATNFIVSPQA